MESIDINTAISTQSERIITRNKCADNTKRYKSKKKLSTELNTYLVCSGKYFQLRNLSLSENIRLRIKRADTDFSFTASDNINCFIVNDDEYHPEGTDIKIDLDNDTLDTSYIPNKNKDEFDNSFVAGTENVNDQEDEGLIHLS